MIRRGVGYCENIGCEDYSKGVFLLNHGDHFYCPRCRHSGDVVVEKIIDEDTHGGIYKQARVEFDYCPTAKRYKQIILISIDNLPGGGTYTIQSPLVGTELRATKIGENIINLINIGIKGREQMSREVILDWALPTEKFKVQCDQLSDMLEEKGRRLSHVET